MKSRIPTRLRTGGSGPPPGAPAATSTPTVSSTSETSRRSHSPGPSDDDGSQSSFVKHQFSDLPRAAHGAGEHSVGFGVVWECLGLRISGHLWARAQADVRDVTERVGAVGGLSGGDGRPAGQFAEPAVAGGLGGEGKSPRASSLGAALIDHAVPTPRNPVAHYCRGIAGKRCSASAGRYIMEGWKR